ncbi:RteC domain-containing protein [Chryseobacterium sp.]|uniref:RteC domain-containing protein n=1 Tax=Chryseobacterium sp. TaxID=1871047 RepID=UPI0016269E98|nr:RteC domain-containing protein [Chryseobacterium sp.]
MESRILFEKCDDLWKALNDRTELLRREQDDFFSFAECVLMETDEAVRQLKSWTSSHEFCSWEEEVRFFREVKPKFVSRFIYYSRILSLEASVPYAGAKELKKFYEKELNALEYFSAENRDFINYYRRKATYLDMKYFLRFRYDLKVKLAPDLHSYDEKFSTSHDILVAHILANDALEVFFKNKIKNLEKHEVEEIGNRRYLEWTASKAALVELIIALHHTKCLNGGNIELAEVIRWAESSLNIDLGNYHKTIGEIRSRKTERTKFLKMLDGSLNQLFTELDE